MSSVLVRHRRTRSNWNILGFVAFLVLAGSSGCASRSFSEPSQSQLRSVTFSQSEVLFGGELEFTKLGLLPNEKFSPRDSALKYFALVKQTCAQDVAVTCDFQGDAIPDLSFIVRNKRTHESFRAHPGTDPQVVEISLDPLTINQLVQVLPLIQKYVFELAKQLDLVPGTSEVNRWSAHANFSWPGLQNGTDVELFLRYFIDLENSGKIALGAMGGDSRNAPPLSYFSQTTQNRVKELIDLYYQEHFGNIFDLVTWISGNIYGERFVFEGKRYHLLNFQNAAKENMSDSMRYNSRSARRIEQRCVYMPLSAEGMVSNYKIIAARLEYLSKQTSRIMYVPFSVSDKTFRTRGVQGGFLASQIAESYFSYLAQANLDLRYHGRYLVNPDVRKEFEEMIVRR
jgi:hypothetical protein